jgi:hypothetical protein
MSGARVAYFTGGTVGAGHLVRGIAIGRALARHGFRGEYRMFGPPLPFPVATRADYEAVPVVEGEVRDPARAPETAMARALAAWRPDLLVVDMFWAPLRHVLPLAGCTCWLLARTCPRAWFTGPPDTRWDARQYARTIAIEPFRNPALRESIDPVVVCNPDECRPPQALRERLGVPPENRLVVATHAGVAGEMDALAQGAGAAEAVVRLDLFDPGALFPLAEWLGGADRVLAAAGYNSFWEARWLGWAPRTRFTPLRRAIDDQAWRAHGCAGHRMRANGADTLAQWIAAG